jgi:hypothetical protein
MKTRITFRISGPAINTEGSSVVEHPPARELYNIISYAKRHIVKGIHLSTTAKKDHCFTVIKIEKDVTQIKSCIRVQR